MIHTADTVCDYDTCEAHNSHDSVMQGYHGTSSGTGFASEYLLPVRPGCNTCEQHQRCASFEAVLCDCNM
jgi:hypothetical protein